MTEVKKIEASEIAHLYPQIYSSVFDDIDPYQSPSLVYLVFEDNNYIGFMSGYLHSSISFMLQYAGIIREQRGYKTLEAFRAGLKELFKDFKYVMCVISNKNIPAIKLALNEDFLIHGLRQDTLGNLFVELIREV